ncbi:MULTISPECIES: methyltransferase [unclassified Sinorhizobium]|uniref:methyltransferase n=1 Tax=unclassified Sinorhizobium TaxID=2613772 RepID=UPI0035237198
MESPPQTDDSHAGQAVYSPLTLRIYDLLVLGISNSFIWKCPTRHILALYNRHLSSDHLDIGVGTGWFLDHAHFPAPGPRVALLDLNAHSLAASSARIARYRPEQYQADILKPLPFTTAPFRSISMTYLLHCLAGPWARKAFAFDNAMRLMHPDGVVFGATLLSHGVARSTAAKKLMSIYNGKGIFGNEADDLDGLRRELERRFEQVSIDIEGCAALFSARGPR